ncbi:MAG: helix-turn-helix domain-containing protein [Acutalibacteraceae bacterium]
MNTKKANNLMLAHTLTGNIDKKAMQISCGENISIASCVTQPPGRIWELEHSHPEYEFMIPKSAIPFLTNEKAPYFGNPGFIYPVSSGKLHGLKYDFSRIEYMSIVIDKSFFEDAAVKLLGFAPELNHFFKKSSSMDFYMNAFMKEFGKGEKCLKPKLESLETLICYEIIEAYNCVDTNHKAAPSLYKKGMRDVADYIVEHYSEQITLEELARMADMSLSHFSYCFKKTFNESPAGFIRKLRISKGMQLLISTNLTVKEIASQCGFATNTAFSEAFKSMTGVYPSEFKSNNFCQN